MFYVVFLFVFYYCLSLFEFVWGFFVVVFCCCFLLFFFLLLSIFCYLFWVCLFVCLFLGDGVVFVCLGFFGGFLVCDNFAFVCVVRAYICALYVCVCVCVRACV